MDSAHAQALSFLAKRSGPGSILHLGVGRGDEVAAYLSSNAERIVLVEPHPDFVQQLAALAVENPRVEVKEAAVAATSGRASLQVLNFAELSSLRVPRGATELFPGLRVVSTVDVVTATLGSLIDALPSPDPTRPDLLVVSAPGEEATIVDALLGHPDRHRFGAVLLRGGAAADEFEGSEPVDGPVERLCADGYRIHLVDVSDPDRPTALMVLGRSEVEQSARFAAMQTRHDALLAENAVLALQVEGQQAAIEEQHAQLLRLKVGGEAEKAALIASRSDEISALTSIRERLAAERDAARAEVEAVTARLVAVEAEREQLANAASGLAVERDAAEASGQQAAAKLAEVSTALGALQRERDESRTERDAARAEVERATARLATVEAERAELGDATAALAAERDAAVASRQGMAAELAEVSTVRDALWRERDEARNERDAARAEVESATARLAAVEAEREELTKAGASLAAERDAAEASGQEMAAKLAEVSAARDALWRERDKARSERDSAQAEVDGAKVRLAAVEAEREDLTKAGAALTAERDAMNDEVKSLKHRIRDVEFRLGLAREEFHRSEGQIALIKDLLLHEGGL